MLQTLRNSLQFLIDDARNRPWFLALETISTILGMASSVVLAMYNKDANFIFVWSAYIASSIGLAFVGYIRQSTNIMVLMSFYTIINILFFKEFFSNE